MMIILELLLVSYFDDDFYDYLTVNCAVYFGALSYFNCHAAGFSAEVYELCSLIIKIFSIFMYGYKW